MDDATCLGLSDAGCDGIDNGGCACADIIDDRENSFPDGCEGNGKVHPDQKQHWSWNARSYFKVDQKMGEVSKDWRTIF